MKFSDLEKFLGEDLLKAIKSKDIVPWSDIFFPRKFNFSLESSLINEPLKYRLPLFVRPDLHSSWSCNIMEVEPLPIPSSSIFFMKNEELLEVKEYKVDHSYAAQKLADEIDQKFSDYLREEVENEMKSRFPHSCPRCGSAAYIGMNDVDCSKGCS